MKRVIFILALVMFMPAAAQAGHGNGKGHAKDHIAVKEDNDDQRDKDDSNKHRNGITIAYHDRVVIEDYLEQHPAKRCPPGLAKKHNGCLPPGQAKKYHVGERLPRGVVWEPVPHELLVMLSPPPHGYRYVQVDRDVLLIGEATKKVIDAVELLSAVGK